MKKIFHSMPLAGKIPAQIEYARNWQHDQSKIDTARYFDVTFEECEVMDTFLKANVPENANALWYFGEGVRTYLSQADILCLAPDWESARGCRVEKAVAEAYGVPTIVIESHDK